VYHSSLAISQVEPSLRPDCTNRMAEASPQSERRPLPYTPSRAVFVGRQRETADLTAALEDSISGQGHIVMLAGEPGLGKTRMAQEINFHADAQGAQIFWGWCYEDGGTVIVAPLFCTDGRAEQYPLARSTDRQMT